MDEFIPETPFSINFVLEKIGLDLSKLENYESEEISKGLGFFSKIIRVRFYWKDEKIGLKSVILKIPVAVLENFQDHLEPAFQREMNFYKIFGDHSLGLKIPKFYYGYPYSRHHANGISILEDLSNKACTPRMLPGLTNKQVEAVIDELAKINVASWNLKNWSNDFKNWYDHFQEDEDQSDVIPKMYDAALEIVEINPEMFEDLIKRSKPLFTYKSYQDVCYRDEKYGFPPCIVHSDLWAPNILFEKDENGQASSELAAIIDWQDGHPGNPCEDIARLLSANTPAAYRRRNTERLLRIYMEKVAFYNDGRAPFTYEQLCEAYNASLGYTFAYLAFGVPSYYNMEHVIDGTYPGEYREELLDRVQKFLIDVLEVYGL